MEIQSTKENMNNVITIDGPAGAGKSTIAKMIANHLNYIHVDSGAIYRGFTYAVIQKIGLFSNPYEFGNNFQKSNILPEELNLKVKFFNNEQIIFLDKENINSHLRTKELTERIKFIADDPKFRNAVNQILKEIAKHNSLVIDGRDMGTEVFPEAKFKFYLEANIEERAKRRLKELNYTTTLEDIIKNIQKRDEEDKNREIGALKIPEDSIIIDTSYLSRNMVYKLILSLLNSNF